ncbi:MAG: AAA family ATPase [Oscillospiraceae bacterium]|nr:AAA family ATPase [Oscillospiraceae bacterium]
MSKIIMVTSGKSGTGKSTVCANVASGLAALGNKTVVVELSSSLRSLDIMLGVRKAELKHDIMEYLNADGAIDLFSATAKVGQAWRVCQPDDENLYLICASLNPYAKLDSTKILGVLEELKQHFDYVVIDTVGSDAPCASSSVNSLGFALSLAKMSEMILVVTTPDEVSVRDCAALSDLLYVKGCENQKLLINKVEKPSDESGAVNLDTVMNEIGIPLAGVLCKDADIQICSSKGISLPPGSLGMKEFHAIANRILGNHVPLTEF